MDELARTETAGVAPPGGMATEIQAGATTHGMVGTRGRALWLWAALPPAMELLAIGLWAVAFTANYLDFDPRLVPAGSEFSWTSAPNYLWVRWQQCGACALWNGAARGGAPGLADPMSSALHPLVAIPTLLWGVVNGAKVTLVACFVLAGWAQWWIGRSLRLGQAARLWGAAMAVVGGYLGVKMENGIIPLALSTTMCLVVMAAALALARAPSRPGVVLLAVSLAATAMAGQQYMQVGLAFTAPAVLMLLLDERLRPRPLWRHFAAAVGLGMLLAGPFLVPFLHLLPSLGKWGDPYLSPAQPLEYVVLNFVIRDPGFIASDALGKLPYPHLNGNYVGWVTVALAVLCLRVDRPGDRRLLLFLATTAACALLAASAIPQRLLIDVFPQVAQARFTPLFACLAAPVLIALGAYGLDGLLRLRWPMLQIVSVAGERWLRFDLRWLLIIPLGLGLRDAYKFTRPWLYLRELPPEVGPVLDALATPSLQWVSQPYGVEYFTRSAVERGMKLTPGVQGWWLSNRPFPKPRLEANRGNPASAQEGETYQVVGNVGDVTIYLFPQREYARVETKDGMAPCQAGGTGGHLRVECAAQEEGTLVVEESSWSGWHVWRDGVPVGLLPGAWLSARAPAGQHVYEFRYEPWDVPVGLALGLLGALLSAALLLPPRYVLAIRVRPWRAMRKWRAAPASEVDVPSGAT